MTNSQLCFLIANIWFAAPSIGPHSLWNALMGIVFIVLTLMTREKKKKADE